MTIIDDNTRQRQESVVPNVPPTTPPPRPKSLLELAEDVYNTHCCQDCTALRNKVAVTLQAFALEVEQLRREVREQTAVIQ